ncbi:MAG: HAMP domain-containing protein [Leptospiraceae bacterium]|nr:HAMP domain-containing protein [Leptospiraceae bacterium]
MKEKFMRVYRFISDLIFLLPIILFCYGFSYYVYKTNSDRFYKAIYDKLTIAAHSIEYILPTNYHDRINGQDSISKEEFAEIKETLNRFAHDVQVEYAYTMMKVDGKFYFTSANSKTKDLVQKIDTYFWEEYTEAKNSQLNEVDMNVSKAILIHSRDRWGDFQSIIIPKKTKSGKEYILGVDINTQGIQAPIRYLLLTVVLIGIGLFLPLAYIASDLLNREAIFHSIFIEKKKKSLLVSLLLSISLSIVFGVFYYNRKTNQIYEYTDNVLLTTALSAKNILPRDYHEKLDSVTTSSYEEIKNRFDQFASDIQVAYIYTMIEKQGKLYYTASNVLEGDKEKGLDTNFMQEVTTYKETIQQSIHTNQILYFNEYESAWGSFRTVLIPIRSVVKKDYVIAVDIPIDAIELSLKKVFYESLLGDFICFLLSFCALLPLTTKILSKNISWDYRIKFISLKFKLGVLTSGLTIVCLFGVSYIFLYNNKIILQKKTLEVCRNFAANISNIAREDLLEDTTYNATNSAVSEILKSDIEGLMDVYIINVYGKYVVDFNRTKVNEYAPETLISYIQSVNQIDLIEEFSIQTNRNILKITYPIFIEYNDKPIKIGVAIFEYDRDMIYKPIYQMQSIVIVAGIVALLLTILLTHFLASYITNPLLSLAKGAQIIAAGNLDHKISISSNDEVGVLSQRFNEMSLNLKKSYDELEEKVVERTADLVKSQATLTTVLSNAPLILFSADVNGIITLSEGQSLNLIGIKSGQAVGVSIYEMFEDNEEVLNAIQTALSGEIKILQIKLEQFSFEVNYSPLYDANGKIIGLISLYFDITESLKAQEIIRSEKEKSDRLLLNILPEKIANELKENGFVKPVLYDSVTVIFTDFKGFTKIASNMLPEDLLEKLDMIFLQFDQICERRNIEKLKTIGDAYMCAGGLPEVNSTHPIDACLAAIEMQNFMNETKSIIEQISGEQFWDMRLGIHTGTVVAGVIGKTKFAYDVWGDAVNTASRMESNGSIGKINISDSTYHKVKDFFECEYRGKIEAKNKGMIDMYFLLRIKPELSRDKEGIIPNEQFTELYKEIIG